MMSLLLFQSVIAVKTSNKHQFYLSTTSQILIKKKPAPKLAIKNTGSNVSNVMPHLKAIPYEAQENANSYQYHLQVI